MYDDDLLTQSESLPSEVTTDASVTSEVTSPPREGSRRHTSTAVQNNTSHRQSSAILSAKNSESRLDDLTRENSVSEMEDASADMMSHPMHSPHAQRHQLSPYSLPPRVYQELAKESDAPPVPARDFSPPPAFPSAGYNRKDAGGGMYSPPLRNHSHKAEEHRRQHRISDMVVSSLSPPEHGLSPRQSPHTQGSSSSLHSPDRGFSPTMLPLARNGSSIGSPGSERHVHTGSRGTAVSPRKEEGLGRNDRAMLRDRLQRDRGVSQSQSMGHSLASFKGSSRNSTISPVLIPPEHGLSPNRGMSPTSNSSPDTDSYNVLYPISDGQISPPPDPRYYRDPFGHAANSPSARYQQHPPYKSGGPSSPPSAHTRQRMASPQHPNSSSGTHQQQHRRAVSNTSASASAATAVRTTSSSRLEDHRTDARRVSVPFGNNKVEFAQNVHLSIAKALRQITLICVQV